MVSVAEVERRVLDPFRGGIVEKIGVGRSLTTLPPGRVAMPTAAKLKMLRRRVSSFMAVAEWAETWVSNVTNKSR